jgi:hypothetical protein
MIYHTNGIYILNKFINKKLKRIQNDKNIKIIAKSLGIKNELELNLLIKRDFYCEHLVKKFLDFSYFFNFFYYNFFNNLVT